MKASIILGDANDFHAQHILDACRAVNMPAFIFDSASFPGTSSLSWYAEASQGTLHLNELSLNFKDIGSVFWSSLNMCGTSDKIDAEHHQIAISDSSSMLRTFLEERSFNWVNSWQVFQFHKVKPRQLGLASNCGVKIPSTYIGNNPDEIMRFLKSRGKCIYKPVYGGALAATVTPELIEHEHLTKVLKMSPVTIQQYIPGTNIRTFVIEDQVYSAEVQSEQIDFRADESAEHIAIETPREIQQKALKILIEFGMKWTAIDWRRDLCGNYYFLEANPSPMFTYFERCTGYPITQQLTRLLRCN